MSANLRRLIAGAAALVAGLSGPLHAGALQEGRESAQPSEQAESIPDDLGVVGLVGAFPDTVESVMVVRGDSSDKERLSFRNWYPQMVRDPSNEPFEGDPDNLAELAIGAMSETPWEFAALGGSDFERPRDLGAGNHNSRLICLFEEPLKGLAERLQDREQLGFAVQVHETEAGAIYESEATLEPYGARAFTEKRFLAMPTDRVLIVTESREDVLAIVNALRQPADVLPDRWRDLANEEALASALIVLREYPAGSPWLKNRDGKSPEVPQRFCLWREDGAEKELKFRLRALPPDEDRWAAVRDFAWVHEPLITGEFVREEGVLEGTLAVDPANTDAAFMVLMTPLLSYGVVVAM